MVLPLARLYQVGLGILLYEYGLDSLGDWTMMLELRALLDHDVVLGWEELYPKVL